jgi:DNA-binding winged helix-turn-helix (wHTH) protein/Tfp pilus assembly protein PilF
MSSYRFHPYTLDVQERRLLRGRAPVPLTPKVFDTLVYLVERDGRLVTKDELLKAVWADAYVEEGSLPRTIHILRKALTAADGEDEGQRQYIETVPTKGYRFVAPVTGVETAPAPPVRLEEQPRSRWRWLWLAAAGLLLVSLAGAAWRTLDRGGNDPQLARLSAPTASGAAFAKYQSGRLYLDRHLPGDAAKALADFEAAIQLDPRFAAAYAGKADAKFFSYWDTGSHDDIAQARLAVRKAIETDPENSYAHTVECRLRGTYDWEFVAAERVCRRAVDLDPKYHEAHRELALLLSAIGKTDDALREMDLAIALAPTSFNKRSRGLLLYLTRRFDEAIVQLQQVEATDPEYRESSRWISRSLEQKQDYRQALEYLVRFRESAGTGSEEIATLRSAFAEGGWPRVLRAGLPADRPAAPSLDNAGTFAQLGELDAAFQVLEAMISARKVMIVHMDSEPRLDPLRSDARFEQLARRVGLR